MRRVIGMDIHRTFREVVFWEDVRPRPAGRVDMTRSGLEGFGRTLSIEDAVVIEATGNAMAVVRVLSPFVARVIVANPMQVKAIAHARRRLSDTPAPRHGDHLLCPGRRAGTQGQPGNRVGDRAGRRAADVGWQRNTPFRAQCIQDRAGPLPPDLDHSGIGGAVAHLRAEGFSGCREARPAQARRIARQTRRLRHDPSGRRSLRHAACSRRPCLARHRSRERRLATGCSRLRFAQL
jgi:hypothetical protein